MTAAAIPERDAVHVERMVGALVGGMLIGAGQRRGGTWGRMASTAGAALIAGIMAGPMAERLRRLGTRRRTVRAHTTIHVARPVHDVFAFCKDFENFPRIVGALRRVVDYQDGRSHWEVTTPSGECLEWDAVVTKYVPNAVIAWRNVPLSAVESTGLLRFAPAPDGGTTLQIDVTYVPRDTALADALFAMMNQPRQLQIDHDLARLGDFLSLARPAPAREEERDDRSEDEGKQSSDPERLTA